MLNTTYMIFPFESLKHLQCIIYVNPWTSSRKLSYLFCFLHLIQTKIQDNPFSINCFFWLVIQGLFQLNMNKQATQGKHFCPEWILFFLLTGRQCQNTFKRCMKCHHTATLAVTKLRSSCCNAFQVVQLWDAASNS